MKPLAFLLADDSASYRHTLRQLIQSRPHWSVVAEAGDGAETVRLAAECAPDVVLMDIHMPVMNGIEATRRIKGAAPRTRVIAFSGYPDEEFHRASLQAGADHFLRKEDLSAESLARLIAALFPLPGGCAHVEAAPQDERFSDGGARWH